MRKNNKKQMKLTKREKAIAIAILKIVFEGLMIEAEEDIDSVDDLKKNTR